MILLNKQNFSTLQVEGNWLPKDVTNSIKGLQYQNTIRECDHQDLKWILN